MVEKIFKFANKNWTDTLIERPCMLLVKKISKTFHNQWNKRDRREEGWFSTHSPKPHGECVMSRTLTWD